MKNSTNFFFYELYSLFFLCFGSYIGALYIGHKITQEEGKGGGGAVTGNG